MKKTVEGEPIVGLQPETVGGHASPKIGPISAIGAALHRLIHPLERKKLAAETRAETGRTREPDSGPDLARSPISAGITGGFSLLMDDSHSRKRR